MPHLGEKRPPLFFFISQYYMIHNCYKHTSLGYDTYSKNLYHKDYYSFNKMRIKYYQENYRNLNKIQLKKKKAIWFQLNKNRLRKKHGFIRTYNTKTKDIPNTEIIKKNITLTFD